eukprot:TRINITY_DN14029_c0_g1_i1.p1 TRINITY_DN14029_c0_g1~~TRINITY_DN14029_c0_g1_i1.p1  ORF type:complete len:332 (-),score=43.68 TRINITY_DN14029_c0_g1_i1:65-1060(-)
MISDFYEAFVLIITYLIATHNGSYTLTTAWLAGHILFSDLFVLLLSFTYSRENIYHDNLFADETLGQELTEFSSNQMKTEELLRDAATRPEGLISRIGGSLWSVLSFIGVRLVQIWNTKIALHALCQSLLLYAFTEIAEYPLSFSLSEEDDDVDSLASPVMGNFCNNKLSNLVLLAVLDNVVYAVGSVIYSFFFVKMSPNSWFGLSFPVIGSGVLGVVVSLWYVRGVNKLVAYVLTSCLIVVPYYCEKYNFYFASAVVDEKYFGFLYSGLALSKNILKTIVSIVFLKAEDHLQQIFSLLLVICAGLVISSILYSAYLYKIYEKRRRTSTQH